jgi:hypothetical protein
MTMTNYDSSNNYYSKNNGISSSSTATIPPVQIVDAKTLVSQTQDRMWKALEGYLSIRFISAGWSGVSFQSRKFKNITCNYVNYVYKFSWFD